MATTSASAGQCTSPALATTSPRSAHTVVPPVGAGGLVLPAASFAGMTNGKSEPGAQAVDGRLIQQRQQHQQQLAFFQGLHSFQASTSSAMGPQGGDVSGEMQRQQQLQQHFFYRQQPLYGNGNGQQYTHAQHPQALLHGRHQLHQEPSAQQQQWQNEAVSSPYSKDTFSAFSFTHRGQDGQPQAQQSQSQQHEQQHQAVLFHRYQQQLAAVAAAAASWAPYMMVQPASLSKESSLSGTMPPGGTTLHPGSFGSVSGAGTVANLLPPTTHPYAHSLASAYAPLALPVGAPWMTVWPPTVPSMGLSPAQLFLGGSANGSAGDHVRYHNGAPASKRPHVMSTGSNNADGGNGGSTEDSYRLVVDEAKRFVAHVARSRKTVDTVIPEQLGILSDLTSEKDKVAAIDSILPDEGDAARNSKPGTHSICRQCSQARQLHGRAPLCMPCVKHNGANMRLFRENFPGVSPADHLELFVFVTLRRHFAHSRHRCTCEDGPRLDCDCLKSPETDKCVPCRFLRGLVFVIAYNMWCKHV